jgi:hypothetical protein
MSSQGSVSPLAFLNNDCNMITIINNTNTTTMMMPQPPHPSAAATYTDRQTDRQTEKWMDGKTGRQICRTIKLCNRKHALRAQLRIPFLSYTALNGSDNVHNTEVKAKKVPVLYLVS